MSTLVEVGNSITGRANEKYGEPPYGHAELSSLRMFAKRTDLNLQNALGLLKKADIQVKNPTQTILEIAKNKQITPKELYHIMKPATIRSNGNSFPANPSPGFGNKILEQVCKTYGLDLQIILRGLKEKQIHAKPENTIKEIAEENSKSPMAVFEAIHELSQGNP
jgi:hypothetical protein